MEHGKNLIRKMVFAADLSDEPIPGLPLVEIAGNGRVLIENHRGVTEYGTCCIRVKVRKGQICIEGSNLVLARMTQGQLVISGIVDCVRLFMEG